jgi:DNA-binding transcriptional LysR family regulator
MALTPVGVELKRHCEGLTEQAQRAEALLQRARDPKGGVLRVAMTHALGVAMLAPIVRELRRLYPLLRLEAVLDDGHLDLVEGRFDVGLRVRRSSGGSIVARKLGALSATLCASPGYCSQHPPLRAPEDLAAHACLALGRGGRASWELVEDGIPREVSFTPSVAVNSYVALRELALAGCGVALLPRFLGAPALADGSLRSVLQGWRLHGPEVFAVFPTRRQLSAHARSFVEAAERLLSAA